MNIFLATWLEDNQGITLTKAEATKRLMSYFFIKDVADPKSFFESYINTGIISHYKRNSK